MIERFRDDWLIVVDKPTGLPTQQGPQGGDNLFDRLRDAHAYVGLHHRLDTPASGLLLFTLDRGMNQAIADALRDHTVRRTYLAILYGELDHDAIWTQPIDRKPARTTVEVKASHRGLVATQIELHTGRTHQIRKHAAMAGVPICGDRRYGAEAGRRWPRLALHAHQLSLTHPATGELLTVTSPVPDDLVELWAQATESS